LFIIVFKSLKKKSPIYDDFDAYDFQNSSTSVSIKEYLDSFERVFFHKCSQFFFVQRTNYHDEDQIQTCLLDASIQEHKISEEEPLEILSNQPRYDHYDVEFHKQQEYISLSLLT